MGRARLLGILLLTGCSALRDQPRLCRATSAGVGAVVAGGAAGAGVSQLDLSSHHEGGAIAGAAVAGAALGALGGFIAGQYLCEPEAASPPPPAPAPPPPPPPPAAGTVVATLVGPHFAFGQATLSPEGRARIDAAAEALQRQSGVRVVVEGHTDAVGSDSYNLRLSERRAQAVRDHLVERGVAAERIEVRGVGKAAPVADNATAAGRAQNRRVEIIVR